MPKRKLRSSFLAVRIPIRRVDQEAFTTGRHRSAGWFQCAPVRLNQQSQFSYHLGVQRPEVYRTIVQDDRHGATLDDIEHTISSAVNDPVVRKS